MSFDLHAFPVRTAISHVDVTSMIALLHLAPEFFDGRRVLGRFIGIIEVHRLP